MLLVEGRNDEQVVLHICNRHSSFSVEGELGSEQVKLNSSPNLSFSVVDMHGDAELLKDLRNQLSPPSPPVVGIIMDADDDISKRWNDIRERTTSVGISLPDERIQDGTIIDTPGLPRFGVWIMPDNESSGELEAFAQQMLPVDDPVWPLSQRYIAGIPDEHRKFAEGKILKAQFHAWLATRRRPGLMGLAIRARDLDIDGPLCRRFVAWLEELFG